MLVQVSYRKLNLLTVFPGIRILNNDFKIFRKFALISEFEPIRARNFCSARPINFKKLYFDKMIELTTKVVIKLKNFPRNTYYVNKPLQILIEINKTPRKYS